MKVFKNQRLVKALVFIVVLCFSLTSFPLMGFAAEIGTCRKARNSNEEDNAPHLFFSIATGKELLLELKGLRNDKQKLTLIESKLKLNDEIMGWYKIQIDASVKTVDKLAKEIVGEREKVKDLTVRLDQSTAKVQNLTLQVAQYKGERYQWLLYGIGGTVIVVVLGIVAYGIYSVSVVK